MWYSAFAIFDPLEDDLAMSYIGLDSEKILKMMETENDKVVSVYHCDAHLIRRQMKQMGVTRGHVRHGLLRKVRNTPHKMMNMSFRGMAWELLVEDEDFVALYKSSSTEDGNEPEALWPIFNAKKLDLEDLIAYCKYPWGEREDLFGENDWGANELHPVPGQPHVVWVRNTIGASWLSILEQLQEEYKVKFGLAQTIAFSAAFGGLFDYAAIDHNAITTKKHALLPSGKRIKDIRAELPRVASVVRSMGFDYKSVMEDFEQLRLFNIASTQRAALTWKADGDAKRVKDKTFKVEPEAPRAVAVKQNMRTRPPANMLQKSGKFDGILCNTCSLWRSCPQYREGEVCAVPGSDGRRLAKMFGSRDPSKIIDALGEWNTKMAERALDALDDEMPTEDKALDATVTTALNQVFANGVKLAKLVDPTLNGGVQLNIGAQANGRAAVQAAAMRVQKGEANERELAATVIAELEADGHARADITEQMVRDKMREYMTREGQPELEAEVIEDEREGQ